MRASQSAAEALVVLGYYLRNLQETLMYVFAKNLARFLLDPEISKSCAVTWTPCSHTAGAVGGDGPISDI